VIGKILIHDSKPRFPETLIDKKCMYLPNRDEPITHVVAVKKGKKEDYLDYGHVIACTLNGWVFLVNHLENQILKKCFLQDVRLSPKSLRLTPRNYTRLKEDNIVYHFGAYSNFNLEIAPYLVIHDRLDGLYVLDFDNLTKTTIIKINSCQHRFDEQESESSSDEQSMSSSSDSSFRVEHSMKKEPKKRRKKRSVQQVHDEEPDWTERF
jgi:hypothetical protein